MRRSVIALIWLVAVSAAASAQQAPQPDPAGPCEICTVKPDPAAANQDQPPPQDAAGGVGGGSFPVILRRERSGWVRY